MGRGRGQFEVRSKFRGIKRSKHSGKIVTEDSLYIKNVSAEALSDLANRDPEEAKKVLAEMLTGRNSGWGYRAIAKSVKLEEITMCCEGCKIKEPLLTGDFSSWTKEDDNDYCLDCSVKRQ